MRPPQKEHFRSLDIAVKRRGRFDRLPHIAASQRKSPMVVDEIMHVLSFAVL